MNKKLLLLCSTLLLSVAAFAQNWEKPVPTSREELKVSVEGQDTTIFYLYNKDADAFFVDGNSWATQASIGTIGIPVWFTQNEDGSYLFHDWSRRENKWLLLFIDNESSMFVDHNQQENYFWDIVDMGDKVYRFHGADANPQYNFTSYPNCYMGYYFSDANESTALNAHLDMSEVGDLDGEAYYVDWWLISEADYKAMEPKLLAYDAAKALEPVLEEGEEYVEINLTGIKAVYNNTNSTNVELDSVKAALQAAIECVQYLWEVESDYPQVDVQTAYNLLKSGKFSEADVKAAREAVYLAVRKYEVDAILAGASEEEPADGTELLQNPSFDAGNIDGWTVNYIQGTNVTNLGYQGASYTNGEVTVNQFIEAWANSNFNKDPKGKRTLGNGSVYQLVKGLPAGKYKFECDAIASRQDESNQALEKGAYLYAKAAGNIFTEEIHTNNNAPEHFECVFVSVGGDIEFGFMTENTTVNWICADNFKLWYYGEVQDDPFKVILLDKIAQYERQYPDVDDLAANQEVKDDYTATLEAARECTENYIEMDSLLATKVAALAKSIEDYKRLETMMEDLQARAEAFESNVDFPNLFGKLADYHMDLVEYYDDRTADEVLIDSVQATISKIIVDEITANMKPGVELTPLILNPDFDKNFDSWSYTGAKPDWGGNLLGDNELGEEKRVYNSGNAEKWHASFDMFQKVFNMPKGSFKLTAQAFERNDGGYVDQWEQNPVKTTEVGINAVLYATTTEKYEKKVSHIMAFATPDPLFDHKVYDSETGEVKLNDDGTEQHEWWSDVNRTYVTKDGVEVPVTNGGWIPNSMDGANFHFTADPNAYLVEVNFNVKNDGDSIIVGLKNTATNSWVIFDNFRLFYNGDDASAYKEAIDKLMADLNGVFKGDNVVNYGKDAVAKVDAAKEALNAAVASNIGDQCAAALDQGYEALEYAKTSIADYAALDEAYNQLGADIEEYSDVAPAATLAKANELYDTIEKTLTAQDKTNEEVEYLIDRAKYYGAAFKVPDTEGASVDNPIDLTEMIINSTFDTVGDFTGWSGSGFGAGGDQDQSAERYSMGFDTYQDIAGLPAGYYVAYVQAFYRHGSSEVDYAKYTGEQESDKEAYFYATSSVESAEMPIAFCSEGAVPSGTDWVSGATSAVGSGYVNPNTMVAFGVWCNQFSDDSTPLDKYTNGAIYYNHVLPVQVGEDGKLRIGVKKDGNVDADWFICDNFRLYYIGTEGPDPAIDSAIKGVEIDNTTAAAKGIYNLAGQKLAAPVKGFNIINGQKYFVK